LIARPSSRQAKVLFSCVPSTKTIRRSFLNASKRERDNLVLPANFAELDWDNLDYLGWRDPKVPGIGYVFVELDNATDHTPTGILLRRSEGSARSRPQCTWCEDVTLPNDVTFFSAKRGGDAGRKGDTIGTLVCDNFQCSANVRKAPPIAYLGFDVEAAKLQHIEALGKHVRGFVREVAE
jgi:hypothetical protein